jgi:hypothetical protein
VYKGRLKITKILLAHGAKIDNKAIKNAHSTGYVINDGELERQKLLNRRKQIIELFERYKNKPKLEN